MAELRIRTTRQTIRVAAPPRRVYGLIADTAWWPQLFDPTVTVAHLGWRGAGERVRLWELVDGEVRSHVAYLEPNPRRLQVRYRLEDPEHPVASMGGIWLVLPKGSGSLVALDHYYRVVGDDPAEAAWLADAMNHNSMATLAAVRDAAELGGVLDGLWLSSSDSVDIDGDGRDVYDFLARAHDWPQRLAHVEGIQVDEDVFDVQHLAARIRLPNGSLHATNTVRVCFPDSRIIYKQTRPPAIMRSHTGSATITQLPRGVRATVSQTVLLNHDAVAALPSTVEEARAAVRDVLHSLSMATLNRAKKFAEARRPLWAEGAA